MNTDLRRNGVTRGEIKRAEQTAEHLERVLSAPIELEHSLRALVVLANTLQQSMDQFSIEWIDKHTDQLQAILNTSTSLAVTANDVRDRIILALGTVIEHRLQSLVIHEATEPALEALSDNVTIALNHVAEDAAIAQERALAATQRAAATSANDDEQNSDQDPQPAPRSVIQTLSAIALQQLEEQPEMSLEAHIEPNPANPESDQIAEADGQGAAGATDDVAVEAGGAEHPTVAAESSAGDEPVVANRRTGIYHPAGSALIKRISGLNRIAFVSAEAAEVSGFRKSRSGVASKSPD